MDWSASPPRAFWRCHDQRWVSLHSARDPWAEAARWLDDALADRPLPALVIVIGAGLGYLVDVVEQRSPAARVLILEPEPDAASALLARRDWSPLTQAGRLILLTGPGYFGAADAWRHVDPEAAPPLLLVHPVLRREATADAAAARRVVDRILFDAAANAGARRRFEAPALLHSLRNLPSIAGEADAAALDGCLRDVPAVVVGAGPSLDRNLADLRQLDPGVAIIAADTAARPLLCGGVTPHLIVAVDPGELNARHLEGLPDSRDTFLVAESGISPRGLAPFAGRSFVFRVGRHAPWPWLEALDVSRGELRAWGSVVTSALDLALRLGCSPIAFAGVDLAFTEDRPYCRGTAWEEDWRRAHDASGRPLQEIWRAEIQRTTIEPAVDLRGERVSTTPSLRAFGRRLFEMMEGAPEREFLNVTGAGLLYGPPIRQGAMSELSARVPRGRDASVAERVRKRWHRGRASRPSGSAILGTLLSSHPLAADDTGEPWTSWKRVLEDVALVDLWAELAHDLAQWPEGVRNAASDLVEHLVDRRELERALALLPELITRQPTPRLWYLLAFCLHMTGTDVAAAVGHYQRAFDEPRLRFWALVHHALACADLGRLEEARADLARIGDPPRLTPAAVEALEALRARVTGAGTREGYS